VSKPIPMAILVHHLQYSQH